MSTDTPTVTPVPVGHEGVRVDIVERPALALNGWLGVAVAAACGWAIYYAAEHDTGLLWLPIVLFVLVVTALVVVTPGQTSVVQFFGSYVGTVRRPGFWWILPLTIRRQVSVRVRNFETNHLKVNDADGNPVEIAAIVVWQVADTAQADLCVDSYSDFVACRPSRRCATSPPATPTTTPGCRRPRCAADRRGRRRARPARSPSGFDRRRRDHRGAHQPPRLRAGDRPGDAAAPAGERGGGCAYPDRRGRGRHGRAGPRPLSEHDVVELDDERKASMVSNLLVVLCGDQPPSPVVNAGSLYT